jgi:hypothetical protein
VHSFTAPYKNSHVPISESRSFSGAYWARVNPWLLVSFSFVWRMPNLCHDVEAFHYEVFVWWSFLLSSLPDSLYVFWILHLVWRLILLSHIDSVRNIQEPYIIVRSSLSMALITKPCFIGLLYLSSLIHLQSSNTVFKHIPVTICPDIRSNVNIV